MSLLAEARFYSTGWAFRVGLFQLRYNSQENYKALSLEIVGRSYLSAGGMSWREFRLARKQAEQAAIDARRVAQLSRPASKTGK